VNNKKMMAGPTSTPSPIYSCSSWRLDQEGHRDFQKGSRRPPGSRGLLLALLDVGSDFQRKSNFGPGVHHPGESEVARLSSVHHYSLAYLPISSCSHRISPSLTSEQFISVDWTLILTAVHGRRYSQCLWLDNLARRHGWRHV
jgi:hypothetical protein